MAQQMRYATRPHVVAGLSFIAPRIGHLHVRNAVTGGRTQCRKGDETQKWCYTVLEIAA